MNGKVYCNLCNKKMTLVEYNYHYVRCLQVQTLWRKSKNLGKEIPREEMEQFGDDILDKLEEKYIGEATSIFTKIQELQMKEEKRDELLENIIKLKEELLDLKQKLKEQEDEYSRNTK